MVEDTYKNFSEEELLTKVKVERIYIPTSYLIRKYNELVDLALAYKKSAEVSDVSKEESL